MDRSHHEWNVRGAASVSIVDVIRGSQCHVCVWYMVWDVSRGHVPGRVCCHAHAVCADYGEARMAVHRALGHVWGLSFVGVM